MNRYAFLNGSLHYIAISNCTIGSKKQQKIVNLIFAKYLLKHVFTNNLHLSRYSVFMVSRMHSAKLFFFISYSLGRFLFDLAIFFGLKYILQMYNIGSIYRFVHNVIDKIMPFEFQLMQLARCSYCNVVKRNNRLKFKACFDIDTIYPTNNLIYNKANEKIQFLVFFF